MKVYIVGIWWQNEGGQNSCVFSSREAADEYIKTAPETTGEYFVEEFEVE